MASAPRPGVSRREEEASAASKVLRISVPRMREAPFVIAPGNIPIDEKMAVFAQTGKQLEGFLAPPMGELSVAVLCWLAERTEGRRSLSWAEFMQRWPVGIGEDDLEVIEDDGQGDAPEASGPA